MVDYETELKNQKIFITNVVVKMLGEYFTIHTPDSGLTPKVEYKNTISSPVVNPSTIDPRRVSTTIETRSFKIQDRNGAVSRLIGERGADVIGADVEIWVGRIGVGMAFSEYNKLPVTKINDITKSSDDYVFSASGDADRMNRAIFSATARLSGSILAATSDSIMMKDDISQYPSSGYLKIEKEFIGYASKNDGTKTFSTLTRGEFTTIPADYDEDVVLTQANQITDNPLSIILRILSSGGGGAYDDLDDGIGLADTLIDISGIEELRDSLFSGLQFTLALYGIDKALPYIEKQLLEPCNLRFTYSRGGLLTLALLDKAKFVDAIDVIDEDTVTSYPQWSVNKNRIVNTVDVDWDYNESTGKYEQSSSYRDEDSIAAYGINNSPLSFEFKGAKAALGGHDFVDDFANALLSRLAQPSPEIQVKTQLDKSLLNVADKSVFASRRIPNSDGRLNFASELEIISRAINFEKGEVTHKLAFTSFSDIRTCYIAPTDAIAAIDSQAIVDFGAGRGALWLAGWRCRLWDPINSVYVTTQVNEILSIASDKITFTEVWDTTLSTDYEIRFPDYDSATTEQKRYCYTSDGGNFPDGGKTYSIIP